MNDLNSVIVEGNLTRDPVLSTTPTGRSVCNFSVGSHHRYKRDDTQLTETSFLDVEVWNKLASNCAEYLRKGRGVRVVGRLKQDRWKNSEGEGRSRVKILAEHVEFRSQRRKQEEEAPEEESDVIEGTVYTSKVPSGDPPAEAATSQAAVEELSVL
jgi:single-strand DNA-binding protein